MRKLEVIVLNSEDSVKAQQAGADRLELVSDMEVGGLSPDLDVVKAVVDSVSIPVNVMVRFKADSFVYSEQEFEELIGYLNDVKKLGANGVVFGSLTDDFKVEESQLQTIAENLDGMDFTFHRAIDQNSDAFLENINTINEVATTVLTSGGIESPIIDNLELLNSITNKKVRVLLGGGINKNNYQQIIDSVLNCDIHIGSLAYNNGDFTKGINLAQVKEVRSYLSK